MSTQVFDAKRALFALINTYAAPGEALDGVQVAYAYPGGNIGLECIYGGGVRFDHTDAIAEGTGVLVREIASMSVYIRVVHKPAGPVEDADIRAAQIGNIIGGILRVNPTLAGGGSWIGITSGAGDYSQTADETVSILSYQVVAARNITYGGS